MAVDGDGCQRAQPAQHARHGFGQVRAEHADRHVFGAGRIGQRAEDVEHGAGGQFAPRTNGVAHGRVVVDGVTETDAGLVDAVRHLLGVDVQPDAQRAQHVCAARLARDGAVAMLGDGHAGAGDDESRGGGDVEGAAVVAAGADDIGQRAVMWRHRDRVGAHGACTAGDLRHRLALHAQRDQEAADLRLRRFAGHDLHHGRVGFVLGQVAPVEQRSNGLLDHGVSLGGTQVHR